MMTEENTPIFNSDNPLSDFLNRLSSLSSNSESTLTCSILLISKNQALSTRLYENDFVELGRFTNPSRAQLDLSLLIQPQDGVSRKHAILYFVGGRLLVADSGSQNGTYLNGERLQTTQPVEIMNKDCLMLGRLKICLQIDITEHK